ncbi:MAG: DUF2141 domain-containing protein [Myxococcales bacterium]|nr:DUF2141 domain-containing protein [Myxococcales bacterium]
MIPSPNGTIVVDVVGLRSRRGHVLAAVYASAEGFPHDPGGAVRRLTEIIDDDEVEVYFEDLPPGRYAVTVLHDEDDDGELSTNVLGIPTDGLGMSNFSTLAFRRPGFDAASFDFEGGEIHIPVRIHYMS